jgi:cyclopropane fatty-acyl-phospholipid synthase-like methyltransferase
MVAAQQGSRIDLRAPPQKESLEVAQDRKLDLVCRYSQMKKGSDHLDIGCGWGTLLCHATKNFGTNSYGVTLANEQKIYLETVQSKVYKIDAKAMPRISIIDYRLIPVEPNWPRQFDVITCLEMAEHVGIKNFQAVRYYPAAVAAAAARPAAAGLWERRRCGCEAVKD